MFRRSITLAVLALTFVVASVPNAQAEVSRGVISAFRGQLVVSKDELPTGKNDKDTIAQIKSARLTKVTGEAQDEVTYWHFHYTAFLSKTGSAVLKVKFFTDDKDKRYVADKQLDGIDPKSAVLSGDLSINEDEGLAKGKSYVIKLFAGEKTVVAQATLKME